MVAYDPMQPHPAGKLRVLLTTLTGTIPWR